MDSFYLGHMYSIITATYLLDSVVQVQEFRISRSGEGGGRDEEERGRFGGVGEGRSGGGEE